METDATFRCHYGLESEYFFNYHKQTRLDVFAVSLEKAKMLDVHVHVDGHNYDMVVLTSKFTWNH